MSDLSTFTLRRSDHSGSAKPCQNGNDEATSWSALSLAARVRCFVLGLMTDWRTVYCGSTYRSPAAA